MSKTNITLEIEDKLIKKFKDTSYRYAKEVSFKDGIVDFITAKMGKYGFHEFTCYEIKVSFSDFKSEHGHNFFGDLNWYVITSNLYDEIMTKNANLLWGDMGIMIYKNGAFYVKREPRENHLAINLTERYVVLDTILMNWIRGNMKSNDYVLKSNYDVLKTEKEIYKNLFLNELNKLQHLSKEEILEIIDKTSGIDGLQKIKGIEEEK